MWRRQRRVQDRAPSVAPGGNLRQRELGVGDRVADRARAAAEALAKANADLQGAELEEEKDATLPESEEEMTKQGVCPLRHSYHETPLLSIGKDVRVVTGDISRRALIECINPESDTVDVLFYGLGRDGEESEDEEEGTVSASTLRPLEDFELRTQDERREALSRDLYGEAVAVKEDANALFRLKDYAAAAQLYGIAIEALRKFDVPEFWSECWVLMNHNSSLVLGAVRSVDRKAEKADVALYRPDEDRLQVFRGAPWRCLIPVHEERLALHGSLYTNRAKSLVQLGRHQEAAQDLTVSIGLWAARDEGARRGGGRMARPLTPEEVAEQHEQLVRAYYLRARTRLARSKLPAARGDLLEALSLEPPPAMASLLRQLERDVDVAQRELAKSNRCLAKEVAKWADQAMSKLDASALLALEQGAARAAAGDDFEGKLPEGVAWECKEARRPHIVSL